jgi:probable HAF family extracellular repeat protein
MNNLRLASILAAAAFIAGASPIYTLTDLGTLGGSYAMATGVNASGQAVGVMTTPYGSMNAFTSSGSSLTNLTANSTVATDGQAEGINNAGQVAGTQYIGGQTYATVWNNGVATAVGGAGSYAMAINNSGGVAGMLVNNGQGNAFVSENGTVIDLGTLTGGSWSAAYGLNDAGQAAGYGMAANGDFSAFIWTPGQGYSILGTLGGANSYAMAINNAGVAAGSAQVSSGYMHAFVSNGGSMEDLGTLGGSVSYAYGINDLGNVVGYSSTTGNAAMDGFIEEGGVMYDINALLIDAPGWVITGLYGINDSNQVVGVGVLNGVEHAVLLSDPPAPGSGSTPDSIASVTTPEPAVWISTFTGLTALILRKRFTLSASRPRPRQRLLPGGRRR